MTSVRRRVLQVWAVALCVLGLAVQAQPAGPRVAPRLFFTDIESAPGTGGQDGLGAFITIWGEGFGATRGASSVTIGGVEVGRYVAWGEDNGIARGLDMIVVQPGPLAVSGSLVVTVDGQASNPLPFTLRGGQIYFVAPAAANADDGNAGSFAAPFSSLYRARQVLRSGDIVYVRGGVFAAADPMYPGWDAVLMLHPETDAVGTAELPVAYVGYPGERPVLGGGPPLRRAIVVDGAIGHYVFANLGFTHYGAMLDLAGNGHRIVGNHLHDGIFSNGGTIGILGNSAHYRIYGNLIRNTGEVDNNLNGSGFYLGGFGTNRDIDFGWNEIRDQRGSRAIQVYGHEPGDRIDDVRIHDNVIAGSERNNILLGGSDGGTDVLGTVHVYNNIIADALDQGLRINDPQGTVVIENNVFYNNGAQGFDGNAQIFIERAGAGRVVLRNNILHAGAGQTYYQFAAGMDASVFSSASRNLVYNAGACPAWGTGCIHADPMFVDPLFGDFRVQASSPAIDAGADTGIGRDHAGIPRPQGGDAYDIGAHEFVADAATTRATADCVFGWAERAYADLLAPGGAVSQVLAPYYYRHYPATNAYVGVSSDDGVVYYLGPASGHTLLAVGPLAAWKVTAGCP